MGFKLEKGVYSAGIPLVLGGAGLMSPPYTIPWYASCLSLLAGCALMLWGLRWDGKHLWTLWRKHPPAPSDHYLYAEVGHTLLPTKAERAGKIIIFYVAIWETGVINVARGVKTVTAGMDLNWGDEKSVWVPSITVTNYGSRPIAHVRIVGDMRVQECLKTEGGTSSGATVAQQEIGLLIEKVDPGQENALTFYIINNTKTFADFTFKHALGNPIGATSGDILIPLEANIGGVALFPGE